jgi:hypothetical protein
MYAFYMHQYLAIATDLGSSPPNVASRRDIISPMLVQRNALLGWLAMVQLSQGIDEFRLNQHEKGKILYRPLLHLLVTIDNNKEI